ncbi:MAG: mercury methylation corrinoid protein HgcA [Actinomycetota bacterium]|nr:MAG: CO dehydrogenase/acetyl-CoA synthase subunit delta TIM [Actinomycetota bacterium]MDP3629546.1 mercury methylation corrinoid protein HgcA [Actinomycetota bacterium]
MTESTVPQVSSTLSAADTIARWKLRWRISRDGAAVSPGLFRIGEPSAESPVIVTCNYRMTFDLVRRDLGGLDVWLLVLDTRGVNVWCAAGKGTFSSRELMLRAALTGLERYVSHRTLVLPQLGATGVSAADVRATSGWRVVFGPVRSRDLKAFLAAGMKATPAMRAVTFTFAERMAVVPVELVGAFVGWFALIPFALLGIGALVSWGGAAALIAQPLAAYLAGVIGGGVLVPALLPWLPGRALSLKGAEAGVIAGLLAGLVLSAPPLMIAADTLLAGAVASYIGVNFTGTTPYTSPSGVEKELRVALPLMGAASVLAGVLWVVQAFGG